MFKYKKVIFIPFLILILFFNGCKQKTESKKENVKVLAIMSLTGEAKAFGESSKNALKLLTKDFAEKGIDLLYLDDQNKKKKVEDSLKDLITKEKVKAIILSTQNNTAEAAAKIAAENEVVVINTTSTDAPINKIGGDFLYNLSYSNEVEGEALANFTYNKLRLTNAAIIYNEDDAYSKNLADYYRTNLEKLGGKVIVQSSYKNNTGDYSDALAKLKSSKPDVLFIPDYYYKASSIGKQARELGINSVLMGGDGWDNNELVTNKVFQGAYFSNQFSAQDSMPGTTEFKKKYEEAYKAPPDARAALTYDAGKLIMLTFDDPTKAENIEKLKESLGKTTMEGVTGKIAFTKDNRALKALNIVNIKNNTLQIVDKVLP